MWLIFIRLIYVQDATARASSSGNPQTASSRLMRFLARDLVGFTFLLDLLQEFLDEFLLVFASSVDRG